MDLKELGFTKEELQNRVVERCCDLVLGEDPDEFAYRDTIEKRIRDEVNRRIEETVTKVCDDTLQPIIDRGIKEAVIQHTNNYGEPKGEPVTFTEYLVKRAHNYLLDNVNSSGETKTEFGSYGWKPEQTRVCHLLDRYLRIEIETAMKQAVVDINQVVTGGIRETVKIKLADIAKKLKVEVRA